MLLGHQRSGHRRTSHDFAAVGFCGGLTTFSTFAVEVARLGGDGSYWLALGYSVVSVAASVGAVVLGAGTDRRALVLAGDE